MIPAHEGYRLNIVMPSEADESGARASTDVIYFIFSTETKKLKIEVKYSSFLISDEIVQSLFSRAKTRFSPSEGTYCEYLFHHLFDISFFRYTNKLILLLPTKLLKFLLNIARTGENLQRSIIVAGYTFTLSGTAYQVLGVDGDSVECFRFSDGMNCRLSLNQVDI